MIDLVRLKAAYRALPPGRRAPPRLEALAARLANRAFGRASTAPVRALEAKLLAGFAGPAAAELAAMAAGPRTHPRRAAEAAWTLARWHAGRGAPQAALEALAAMRARAPRARAAERRLVEADCLIRLGRAAEARALLAPFAAADPEAALLLAAAQDAGAPARRALVAAAFGRAGGLAPGDPAAPASLDALDAEDAGATPGLVPGLVSVIVPVYRQWDLAPRLLGALGAQGAAPGAFEVLLVDNEPGAGRPALDLAENVRIVDCARPGAYAARNAGVAAARGDRLVFTDADCLPDPGWLGALAAAAAATPGALLAGPVRIVDAAGPGRRDDLLAREQSIKSLYLRQLLKIVHAFSTKVNRGRSPEAAPARGPNAYACYDRLRGIPQARYVRRGYAATANLAVPRAAFDAAEGFDAARFSGGDAAFCHAARRAGFPVRLVPDAVVGHPVRDSWPALATKARRVKGGQLTGGAPRQRAVWLLRSLTPPFRATARFLRAEAPWPERAAAIAVLYRLWGVELAEIGRILRGGPPERE